ncbi:glycosyltransferase family 2 protein [Omnitrophica bacterium]|nr:glycosyltransferase family 2 protein [Candidatus Omnitrophota bacterium]
MNKIHLSAAIITKNEEKNIRDCLKTVEWADEIVILDDHSADKTIEIAGEFGARVYQKKMDIEGSHRNHLYSLCSNEWVLSVDADERVTPALRKEVIEILIKERQNPRHSAYSIPIKTYIGDRWAKYAGWYPAPKVRLFKKGKFRYDNSEVHPRIFLDGSSGFLKNDIIHYAYRDLSDLFRNVNEQTTLQAKEWYREGKRFSYFTFFRTPIDRLIRKYFFKGGIKGGFLGFILSISDSFYQFESYAKLWELYDREEKQK